jgi:hypothetical protein
MFRERLLDLAMQLFVALRCSLRTRRAFAPLEQDDRVCGNVSGMPRYHVGARTPTDAPLGFESPQRTPHGAVARSALLPKHLLRRKRIAGADLTGVQNFRQHRVGPPIRRDRRRGIDSAWRADVQLDTPSPSRRQPARLPRVAHGTPHGHAGDPGSAGEPVDSGKANAACQAGLFDSRFQSATRALESTVRWPALHMIIILFGPHGAKSAAVYRP